MASILSSFSKRFSLKRLRHYITGGSDIKDAFRSRDLDKLRDLCRSADHWIFINQNIKGYSLLHNAIANNDYEVLDIFLQLDYTNEIIDNMKNKEAHTPLHQAIQMQDYKSTCKLVEAGANLEMTVSKGFNVIHIASALPSVRILDTLAKKSKISLLHAKSDEGSTPIIKAAEKGHLDNVSYLLDNL